MCSYIHAVRIHSIRRNLLILAFVLGPPFVSFHGACRNAKRAAHLVFPQDSKTVVADHQQLSSAICAVAISSTHANRSVVFLLLALENQVQPPPCWQGSIMSPLCRIHCKRPSIGKHPSCCPTSFSACAEAVSMVQGWSSVLQEPAACSRTLVVSNSHFSRCSAAAEAARVHYRNQAGQRIHNLGGATHYSSVFRVRDCRRIFRGQSNHPSRSEAIRS